jgi:amino acid transporter
MLTGLGIAVILYMLVAVAVVSVLTSDQIAQINADGDRALLSVVSVGAPDFPMDKIFPFLAVFAVANTALINMLMASRLIYGMARQNVLPRQLGAVLPGRRTPWAAIAFTTLLALGLILYVRQDADSDIVLNLATVTSFLLLCVFAVVNVCCLILRGRRGEGAKTFFTSPGPLPWFGAALCLYLAGPWVDRDPIVYEIAGGLMAVGVILWVVTFAVNKITGQGDSDFEDVGSLGGD